MDSTVKDIIDELVGALKINDNVLTLVLTEGVERAFDRGFNIGAFGGLPE